MVAFWTSRKSWPDWAMQSMAPRAATAPRAMARRALRGSMTTCTSGAQSLIAPALAASPLIRRGPVGQARNWASSASRIPWDLTHGCFDSSARHLREPPCVHEEIGPGRADDARAVLPASSLAHRLRAQGQGLIGCEAPE